VEHFAKTLRIKGLGPAAIKKLNVSNINELYSLTEEEISLLLSSERLAEKLFYELTNSKDAGLERLLPAFSIPLIGKSAAEKLSTVCETIYDITDETCRRAGLGPKARANLLEWLKQDFPIYSTLPFSFRFETKSPSKKRGIICITGKLKSFKTKADAEKVLSELGYTVKSTVTKDVTLLVNESGLESAKTRKAKQAGISIVTTLKDIVGENNGTS
jgi:NAD-dependent DNA ligase